MFSKDLKQLLDEKYLEYNKSEFFIETDPIQIPKCFEEKEDIEIAGFLAASLAWGQRPTIIKKCKELMQLMDYAPHDFVMQAEDQDYERFCNFKHRTFNSYDCVYFLKSLANIYRHHGGLETVFTRAYQKHQDMFEVLKEWYSVFTSLPAEARVLRHIANVEKGSAAKRVNMFLRWMIRRDSEVDLGVWESFDRKDLIVPLDTHVCRVAYYFKLTDTETFSLKNARRITAALAEVFPDDPCLGDFALFGLGVNGEI